MSISLSPIDHWIFKSKFENLNIALNYDTEFVEGPVFYSERTETFWCLQLNASPICNDMCKIQSRLSRPPINVGPQEMNVQFALYLETLHGQRIADEEIHSFSFSPDSHYDSTAVNIPEPITSILKTDDALLVTCDMYLVMDECMNSDEPCIEKLSEDFKLLFNERDTSGNAVLIVGEERISVHKELLWARSSVLGAYFRSGLLNELSIPSYSPEVVKSMLEFMYSADCTPLKEQNLFELWHCANEYGVSHLLNILQPSEMFGIVKLQLDSAKYRWNCMNFTLQQPMLNFNDTGFKMLELKLSKCNIVFRVTAEFNHYDKILLHLFHVKMWNLDKINSVMMEMSVFDNNDNVSIISILPMKPSFEGIYDLSLSLADEFHNLRRNLQEPLILHAQFKFKFQFKYLIILPGKLAYSEARYMNKLQLSEEMNNFFETRSNTDVKIFPSTIENLDQPSENESSRQQICVHSSILRIRSAYFKRFIQSVKEINVPLSRRLIEVLMLYIYSGRVGATSLQSLLDLYDVNHSLII